MKKVKFIYNPFSGERAILKYLDYIINAYQKQGYIIVPFRISYNIEIEQAFTDIDDTYDHILISGGDGTINQIVNIIKKRNLNLPIAVLPTGTANDFANVIGMPRNLRQCIDLILKSTPREIDLGKANDRYFINIFSCGLFTDVSQKTPTKQKNTFGKLAYYFTGLKELPNFKKLNVSIKSGELEYDGTAILLFIFNGRTAGGFEIAHDSLIDDGMLDVIVVNGENIFEKLTFLSQFIINKNISYPKGIMHFKTNKLELNVENHFSTDIDGEPGPNFPVTITCENKAIKVLGCM